MAKLVMMKGLPGSGKSTEAQKIVEQGEWVRVNRDLLRTMLHYDKWNPRNEGKTVDAEKALVRHYLTHDISVVVDDTNLSDYHRKLWSGIAHECDAKFEVKEIDTDVDTCIERDKDRQSSVGKDVIVQNALRYGMYPKPQKGFVLCDLDGTIADCSHRLHHVKNVEKKDWNAFFCGIPQDTLRTDVMDQVRVYKENGHEIIFVTARPEDYKEATLEWMHHHVPVGGTTLIMRRSGDRRDDTEVKKEMYETYFKDKYPIEMIFDDRPSVIRMWREQGLDVTDVGAGIEF